MSQRMNKAELKKLFKAFDNGNGHLSLAEIDRAVTYFYPQFGTNKQAIMRAYKEADTSGNGFVELNEFGKIIDLLLYYDDISKVFQQLDRNKDKRISFEEFKKGHEILDIEYDDNVQLKQEFNSIDTNHGGYILFDEVN
ncbi:unnamed protein product [Didymodactylos carnosus]|uniref:EF-hand domain-containing protein n=1 Tax=Didymodactylos carnosus TaxID=1234261 RepID=A0A814PJU6_9BILA|nr:unnamed protein product [Didymodactylos carnosus]CAF1107000.1 unnamed protein product [Didymodactylos carnosus]CAF3781987.1 unnamed protein product [Didymodactylos carnosus]CAF3871635.1 unnamed protein product [Didymodactylos carnosus]